MTRFITFLDVGDDGVADGVLCFDALIAQSSLSFVFDSVKGFDDFLNLLSGFRFIFRGGGLCICRCWLLLL